MPPEALPGPDRVKELNNGAGTMGFEDSIGSFDTGGCDAAKARTVEAVASPPVMIDPFNVVGGLVIDLPQLVHEPLEASGVCSVR